MRRTKIMKSQKPISRKAGLPRSTKPIPRKRLKPRRKVAKAIRPWKEWANDAGELVRLVCNEKNSVAGRQRYNAIRDEMYERDKGICWKQTGGCGLPILKGQETFDHTEGRGGGKRNDLPMYVNSRGEEVRNHVMHFLCNGKKGSRRIGA